MSKNLFQVIKTPPSQKYEEGKWVITIGNFDGFHLAHQALVNRIVEEKRRLSAKAALLTFHPHPKQVLQPETPLTKIYNEETKNSLLSSSGLDQVFLIPFTKDFASIDPEAFLLEHLFPIVDLKKIIVGYDFNFGRKRAGSTELLEKLAFQNKIEFETLDPVKVGSYTVSSTMIRRLLFEGDFKHAQEFLGRPWSIEGEVKQGDQRGRTLGFPTLNIYPEIQLPIHNGVYACLVEIGGSIYNSVCNIGLRPTFAGKELVVEAHILDFQQEIYGEFVRILPQKFIRKERPFSSLEELKQQIQHDLEQTQVFFKQ